MPRLNDREHLGWGYTRGLDTVAYAPLRFIPPMNRNVSLHYTAPKDRWWGEWSMTVVDRLRHHSPQDENDAGFSTDPGYSLPSSTNLPLRPDFSLPGYVVNNVRGGYRLWTDTRHSLDLLADVNNLFNVHYREPYAQQQLYALGIGVALGGRIRF